MFFPIRPAPRLLSVLTAAVDSRVPADRKSAHLLCGAKSVLGRLKQFCTPAIEREPQTKKRFHFSKNVSCKRYGCNYLCCLKPQAPVACTCSGIMAVGCVTQNIRRNTSDNLVRDSWRLAGVGKHPKLTLLVNEERVTVDRKRNRMKSQMVINTWWQSLHQVSTTPTLESGGGERRDLENATIQSPPAG